MSLNLTKKYDNYKIKPQQNSFILYDFYYFSGNIGSVGSNPNDFIQDETLAHLTVKELNKRVSNLSRDEVVAHKQRRRTLKNRG